MPSPTDPPNTNNRQAASPFAPATDVCTTAHALAHSGGIAPCCESSSSTGVVATGHRERQYQGQQGIRPGAGAYHDGWRHPAARVGIVNAGLIRHLRINERANDKAHNVAPDWPSVLQTPAAKHRQSPVRTRTPPIRSTTGLTQKNGFILRLHGMRVHLPQ
jgi:hypothetical protein